MGNQVSSLQRSRGILHSTLIFVVIAGFLELPLPIYLPMFPPEHILVKLLFLLRIILKIYFYTGIYGVLIELVSKEEIAPTLERFKDNAKRYWLIYALIAMIPILAHLLIFAFFTQMNVSLTLIQLSGDIFLSGLIAFAIISRKYFKPMKVKRQKVILSQRDILLLVLFTLARVSIYALTTLTNGTAPYLSTIFVFLSIYFHLLIFLYLVHLILDTHPEIPKKFVFENELYLINPIEEGGVFIHWITRSLLRYSPAWVSILRALTPEHYHIRVFNRTVWRNRYFASGKLVAITCSTSSNCHEAYKVAKGFKKSGSTVIMGGFHVMAFPDEALEYCDSVVVCEGEGVWAKIVADYENNCLQKQYHSEENEEARQKVHNFLMNSPPQVIRHALETTRGCKYNCSFCALQNMRLSKRIKPVSQVVELMKRIKEKYNCVMFLDSNFYSNPEYLKELFEAIKPLKMKWTASCSLDIAEDEELLTLAKESGGSLLFLGYEIVPKANEKPQGGKLSMAKQYLELSRRIQRQGIPFRAHFIVGFDSQDMEVFWDLLKFAFQLRPYLLGVFVLTPFPGSPFFHEALSENRITTLNWRNYNCATLLYKPKNFPRFFLRQPFHFLYVSFLNLLTTTAGFSALLVIFLCFLIFLLI